MIGRYPGKSHGIDRDETCQQDADPFVRAISPAAVIGGLFAKCWHIDAVQAKAVARKRTAFVARVIDPWLAGIFQGSDQAFLIDSEQWPNEAQPWQVADGRHRCEAIRTTAFSYSKRNRFGLILTMMSCQEVENAHLSAPIAEVVIPCVSSPLLHACPGLWPGPCQDMVLDAERS